MPKDVLTVGVLANDNPQGLLLACRLLGSARVRVSVGGRLSRLLEEGWTLQSEDEFGQVRTVNTRIVRRGEGEGALNTKAEEESSSLHTLWVCDWKDPATGWYSLSDCHLLLQASKATDSKTVAMWLVEVCKDDAVIISLQAGLHNARELRTVFGHVGGSGAVAEQRDMPLVASATGRKTTGSVDTVDGGGIQSRRESASSIYSEFSSMEDDNNSSLGVDVSFERSSSPLPPGFGSLDSPRGSDGGIRRSVMESSSRSNSPTSDIDHDLSRSRSPDAPVRKSGTTAINTTDVNVSPAEAPSTNPNLRKPQCVLLAGVLGFGACCLAEEDEKEGGIGASKKTLICLLTHHGSIVVERLTKQNALQALGRVMLLERTGFKVRYRAQEETNNWLWGDVVWRTFEAYGAALRMDQPQDGRSLYKLLASKDPIHRRVYAGLLDEALAALRWQKVELMDPVSSPFGLGFRATRSLLLLPQPVFEPCLRAVLLFRFPWEARVKDWAPYCDTTMVHRYMAPFLNGEVVRIGFEGEVSTPLNQEILESLSVVARRYDAAVKAGGTPSKPLSGSSIVPTVMVKQTELPKLYSMSFFTAVLSCFVLVLAVALRFIWFVIDVTFFW